MRPAASVNDLRSSDLIVGRITVRLQKTLELSQKLFRSIPSSAQTKVEHHRSSRSTVLPQIGLMVLPSALLHLHVYGSFIGLDVGAAEELLPHRPFQVPLDLPGAHTPRVHRGDLVIKPGESALPLGHDLGLKTRLPISRGLQFQFPEISL